MASDAAVTVSFDQPVQRASVERRFSVQPALAHCPNLGAAFHAAPGGPCRATWLSNSSGFTFEHSGALFAPATTYTFKLEPGVRSADGTENSLDHDWQLTSAPAPVVTGTTPADGDTGVRVDAPLVVSFSAAMDARTTAAAIRLDPPVPGTRVARNQQSLGRLVVLPGRLLAPDTGYTLTVGASATEEHGQRIPGTVRVRFHTAGLGTAGHALVLARRPGEPPTVIELTALAALQAGEPAAAATVLEAPRCATPTCGAVARGEPETAYVQAAIAPRGGGLAVVSQDLTDPGLPTRLSVVSLPGGDSFTVARGATSPSWAPDGRTLAYGAPDGIHLLTAGGESDRVLPAGDPLAAAADWSADGSVLALPVRAADGSGHIELADPALLLRYPVPGVRGGQETDPALSPDGSELALRREGTPDVTGTWIVAIHGAGAPRRLAPDLVPIAYADGNTLLAAEYSDTAGLVRVLTGSGDRLRLRSGPAPADLASAVAAPSGRQVAYLLGDATGAVQAYIENSDGSNPAALTAFQAGSLEAAAVSFGG